MLAATYPTQAADSVYFICPKGYTDGYNYLCSPLANVSAYGSQMVGYNKYSQGGTTGTKLWSSFGVTVPGLYSITAAMNFNPQTGSDQPDNRIVFMIGQNWEQFISRSSTPGGFTNNLANKLHGYPRSDRDDGLTAGANGAKTLAAAHTTTGQAGTIPDDHFTLNLATTAYLSRGDTISFPLYINNEDGTTTNVQNGTIGAQVGLQVNSFNFQIDRIAEPAIIANLNSPAYRNTLPDVTSLAVSTPNQSLL